MPKAARAFGNSAYQVARYGKLADRLAKRDGYVARNRIIILDQSGETIASVDTE
ncbi:MAG: hypothetical protein U1A77_01930 [Pirellulales bacterium]